MKKKKLIGKLNMVKFQLKRERERVNHKKKELKRKEKPQRREVLQKEDQSLRVTR